jgi:hypothetical protein
MTLIILVNVLDLRMVQVRRVLYRLVTDKVMAGMLDRCFTHLTMFRLYTSL